MKWIGQNIWNQVSKFRNDIYLERGSIYSPGSGSNNLPIVAGDITVFNAVNDGDPTISLGSSATERLEIKAQYESGAQGLDGAIFTTYTAGSSTNDGRFTFFVDEVGTFQIRDHGINLYAGKSIQIGNTDIISDSGGTATLSNIDALDATTISTFNAALTAGDITGVTAGTNLSGGGSSGAVTINLADASTSVKGAASFSSDNFSVSSGVVTIKEEGVDLTNQVSGVLPSANMDSDTAHLTGVQTFTGRKTFEDKTTFDGDRSITPGDGVMIHVDASDITDSNTSASGTAAKYAHVSIEHPRLLATNASVTTSDAATLYISGPPVASTNQTITRAHTLWVDSGDVKFDGDLTVDGTIGGNLTGNVTGNTSGSSGSCTGQAATVATIAGLAPNTATTQATQAAITTCANLTTVGTIATGVWQGTAIATDQQKHLAWFTLKGYGTGDGTNYEIPEIISDTNAPFEHNTSTGSDGLTAQTVQTMMRLGGLVVPRAGTLKKWYGWATTSGSQAANIGLFRVRPTRNDSSNLTPVLLDNVSYTALGNTKMEDFDETTFTDADIAIGDIIYTGIKCQSSKTTYFTSTLEIEWD